MALLFVSLFQHEKVEVMPTRLAFLGSRERHQLYSVHFYDWQSPTTLCSYFFNSCWKRVFLCECVENVLVRLRASLLGNCKACAFQYHCLPSQMAAFIRLTIE